VGHNRRRGFISRLYKLLTQELYVQDREAMDVDVLRAVRLWYSPAAAELAIDLKPEENESRLGVGISCTEEVCFMTSCL
jgi:hypothetical protein